MSKMKIGKAKFGGQKKKYWKLKDGESTFRILPPLGELADDGKWSVYYKVHYGYKNAEGKSRPFQSSLLVNRETKEVESGDAAQERIDKLKGELDKAKAAKDKKTVDGLLKFVGGAKSMYNLDSNHYLNAIDEQGNIGVLKLRHKAKLALDLIIRKLRDKGVDPLSVDNGRFFVFSRSGNALETTFNVAVKTQSIEVANVGTVEKEIVHKLSDDIIDRLGDEAAELQKLFRSPTAEQVEQIVRESDLKTGISPNIDAILGIKSKGVAASEGEEEEYVDEEAEGTEAAVEAAPAPAAAPVTAKAEPKAETKVESPLAAAKTEAKAPETKAAPAAPQTSAEKVADMSDDEFLKSLGLN